MKIVVVNGLPTAGKTTFCKYAFMNRGQVYYISTIAEVKNLALQLGWDGKKDEKGRRFLSNLKDTLSEYNDLPRKWVLKEMQDMIDLFNTCHISTKNLIFFIEAREPEEIKKWVREYNAYSVLIRKPYTLKKWDNRADDGVLSGQYDQVIDNTGTKEQWEKTAIEFVDWIREQPWWSYGLGLHLWDINTYEVD